MHNQRCDLLTPHVAPDDSQESILVGRLRGSLRSAQAEITALRAQIERQQIRERRLTEQVAQLRAGKGAPHA
jgi:hypothetical protein